MTRPLLLLPFLLGGAALPTSHSPGEAPKGPPPLDPALPYQATKSNPVTYDVDYRIVVTAPYRTKVLRVWLPLPPSNEGQKIEKRELSTFPEKVEPKVGTEKKYGNTFAYFEFRNPQGAQVIRQRFRVTVWELHWNVDPARVARVERWPASFSPYLGSDRSVALTEGLRKAVGKVVPAPRGAGQDVADVVDWVNGYMKYDHTAASLRASSEHAFSLGRGHCSDYHGLCAAFGRALGYPTRVTYGLNTFAKPSPSHCKLEVFIPLYGWVSFDVSETQLLLAQIDRATTLSGKEKRALKKAAKDRLHRGFRDNTWLLQTRGTDYDLVPPASRRVPVVRTIYAEADGVALPDPDPHAPGKRELAWMTALRFTPDRPVTFPFRDWKSLEKKR